MEEKKEPLIVVNFKTYKQGEDVLDLAKSIDGADKEIDNEVIVGVQAVDIKEISNKTDLTVYGQHVDPIKPGRHTGYVAPEAVREKGARGTFLNHSEHALDKNTIEEAVKRCKEIGLKVMLFCASAKEARELEKLGPDYLVFEPPELVAGEKSVSEAKPELIKEVRDSIEGDFLVGAGIKSKKDVDKAVELGASGIAIASAICKAKRPGEALRRLVD